MDVELRTSRTVVGGLKESKQLLPQEVHLKWKHFKQAVVPESSLGAARLVLYL
jgi:hypothetical protein